MGIIVSLLAVGAVGIGRLEESQKTNTAIPIVEALANEAKRTAIGKNTNARLIIHNSWPNNSERHLRYLAIAYDDDPSDDAENWVLTGRGVTIPKGVYFHAAKSNAAAANTGLSPLGTANFNLPQDDSTSCYYIQFNSQGLCTGDGADGSTGAAVVLVSAANANGNLVLKGNKKDGRGFIVWRNGNTSDIRNPDHMDLDGTN